jgi:hypothetical protein
LFFDYTFDVPIFYTVVKKRNESGQFVLIDSEKTFNKGFVDSDKKRAPVKQ